MSETEFAECVAAYCTATGANAGVREHLVANHRVLIGAWKMTARDFGEVAFRLVSKRRIPNWPKEHTEAIGRELDAIRKERLLATRAKPDATICTLCEGRGIIIVPHPCCIWRGEVTGYYNPRTKERRETVYTVTILCTAPKCWAGKNAQASFNTRADEEKKPRMMTMDQYLQRVGYGTEPTVALWEWEHARAEASRAVSPRTQAERDVWRGIMANILARQEAWTDREPNRDPAEVDPEAIPE